VNSGALDLGCGLTPSSDSSLFRLCEIVCVSLTDKAVTEAQALRRHS
jgi:hypothetical protein